MQRTSQFDIMNKFKLNKTYSYLKSSCEILNKELSTMKEKNNHLKQKVVELELTMSSLLQRTITKEEMKEMIKEGLSSMTNKFNRKEKEITHTQTQTDNIDKIITLINLYKQTREPYPKEITSILELLDGMIVVGC